MEPITTIEVMGKSADQVVEEVVKKVGDCSGDTVGKVSGVARERLLMRNSAIVLVHGWV